MNLHLFTLDVDNGAFHLPHMTLHSVIVTLNSEFAANENICWDCTSDITGELVTLDSIFYSEEQEYNFKELLELGSNIKQLGSIYFSEVMMPCIK